MPLIQTFAELLARSVELYSARDAFRIRKGSGYESITYAQFYKDVQSLVGALNERGLAGEHLAVIGENSYQWVVSYMATVVSGGVIIPIDKELSLKEIATIVEQSQAKALFCSDDYCQDVADELRKQFSIDFFAINCSKSDSYTTLSQLIEQGSALPKITPKENDGVASIVFTSGTTGYSKGVMLTQANLMANVVSADEFITLGTCVLSVLPMHHTYEFTLGVLFSFYQGRTVAINNGIKNFAQNIKLFAPTNMLVVPLVAENMLANIWNNVQKQSKEPLVRAMITISNALRKVGIDLRKIIFKTIHQALGGRLNSLFVGGAPVEPSLVKNFGDFGIKVNIGYGITECSPLVTGNITGKPCHSDTCGIPIPRVEIRINQPSTSGDGEIQVRGANVMIGYYKNPTATQAVMDGEWFRTGDIGRIDKHGMLHITGRVKNLIVLKNGKNVYPEELENHIAHIPTVKEVIVKASENNSGEELFISAEIFIDPEITIESAVSQENIRKAIDLINNDLPYYKRIGEVKFRAEEFPKTTTKKIKRY